jgi:hypothetical protein
MVIDGKITEGYVLLCDQCDEAFVARRLGPSVECPRCGNTDMPADLMADYLLRDGAPPPRRPVTGRIHS